jgi:predicted transcriptional regulator
MNAQTPHSDPMTQAAIQNGAVLRAIASPAAPLMAPGDVAKAAGVPTKNIARTMLALATDGLAKLGGAGEGWQLTDAGRRALQALDVWEGRAEAGEPATPANDVLLLQHHKIRRNPLNARKLDLTNPVHRQGIDELKAQIVAAGDVLQNLVVFPADAEGVHDLNAGERRWTAVGELIEEGLWERSRPLRAIQRENTPGQTAFISLVENSQVALTVMERARAYQALCADTGWSGREAALRTGWDVKSVQQYLQVLRDADPAHIAAHEAGDPDWTWETLRKSVQKHQEIEGEAPAQVDLEDVARPFTITDHEQTILRYHAANIKALSPRQLLILVEAADRVLREPLDPEREGHYAAVSSDRPALDVPVVMAGLSVNQHGFSGPYFAHVSGSALEYLRLNGLLTATGDRGGILQRARVAAGVSASRIATAVAADGYVTTWLDPAWKDEAANSESSPAPAAIGDWSAPMRGGFKVFLFSEISLTVDKSYALAEVAHKTREGGFAAFGQAAAAVPSIARHDLNFKSLVTHGYMGWGRDHNGQDYVRLLSDGEAWLAKSQYPTGFAHGKYRTSWLNDAAAAPPVIGGGATMALPPKAKPQPVQRELTPYETLVLLELAKATDVAVAAGKDLGNAWVKVGKYWLDTAASELRGLGLICFSHEQANGPHAGVLAMGRTRLQQLDYAVPYVLDVDLAKARTLAGHADWSGEGYVTEWLNAEASATAPPERPTTSAPAAQNDEPDEYDLAHDALGQVAQALDDGRDFNPLDLFKVTGVAFPLRLGEGHAIVDNNGEPVLDMVGHGDLVDELLKARSLLFVTALNDLVAPFTRPPGALTNARKVADGPATPIRRSITPEDFVCIEDGVRTQLLARHLRQAYGLTPEAFIERWSLPADYPFVAPNELKRRADLMTSVGVKPWEFRTDEEEG